MRSYGFKGKELSNVTDLLNKFFGDLEDAKVYLFGSRARGDQKEFSDVDLAVTSESPDLSKKMALFREAWEASKVPYKLDLSAWDELFKPYLPQIRKEKIPLWTADEKAAHPWRPCPYGKHWVSRHLRRPINKRIQDVDGHCRINRSGKDSLYGEEILMMTRDPHITVSGPKPCPYGGDKKINNVDSYDEIIARWCQYWNEVFKPDVPLDPNIIKALIESESTFNPKAEAKNKAPIGKARGLIQVTEKTLKILKDLKGEIKDHYVILEKEELFEPEKNIAAGVRWLFRKREILQKRLGRSPSWEESIVEYKGLGPDLKKNGKKASRIMSDFRRFLNNYRC